MATILAISVFSAMADQGPRMPAEFSKHGRSWIAFRADPAIWGEELATEVLYNLATIANTIVEYEPVTALVHPEDRDIAAYLLNPRIEILEREIDDLWIRDTGPVFVGGGAGGAAAIDFNFNGWGGKQVATRDRLVAGAVGDHAAAKLRKSGFTLEGGGIEVDGQGTAILTESSILNANRNPGVSKKEMEKELKELLGLKKIIWLKGIAGKDITDAHVDFYARFIAPGVVVAALEPDQDSFDRAVTLENIAILRGERDANGDRLVVHVIENPATIREDFAGEEFAAGYVNFYVLNGAVLIPEFGDRRRDDAAMETYQRLFPDRIILQLNIDALASGGGGIHCATLQQPVAAVQ
ncbi:MAG: agmatine deiminase family protein [Spirochaetaceae bacterium]|nr:agmatine deiminase family protein [Spirochaetaceae bacterium]